MAWNYRSYARYRCIECGYWTKYKQEWKEFTVTIDNACTTHCTKPSHILRHFIYRFLTFSDISLIDFLLNSVEFGRALREFKLLKANWAASLYCATITCHTSPGARVYLVQACFGKLAPRGVKVYKWKFASDSNSCLFQTYLVLACLKPSPALSLLDHMFLYNTSVTLVYLCTACTSGHLPSSTAHFPSYVTIPHC